MIHNFTINITHTHRTPNTLLHSKVYVTNSKCNTRTDSWTLHCKRLKKSISQQIAAVFKTTSQHSKQKKVAVLCIQKSLKLMQYNPKPVQEPFTEIIRISSKCLWHWGTNCSLLMEITRNICYSDTWHTSARDRPTLYELTASTQGHPVSHPMPQDGIPVHP